MTAPAYPLSRGVDAAEVRPRFNVGSLRPREGWTAFVLVTFMLLVLGWSLDAADYRGGDLYWLTGVMILGSTWGLVSARLGLPRWQGHSLGALIGAAVVLFFAAGQISASPDLVTRLHDLGLAAAQWYRDVNGPTHVSSQTIGWQVTCGAVSWTTAQFSSYAVFGHRRPIVAIVVPGVFLLVNMLIAAQVGIGFLIAYSAAALLLLVRVNLVEQQDTWARHRIGEASDVSGTALRSGIVVVGVAVVLALALASVGSSAPLAGLWQTFQGQATDVVLRVNDWFSLAPAVRFHGDPFEQTQRITGVWDASSLPTLKVTTSDGHPHYLRGTVYDRFIDGDRWVQSGPSGEDLGPGAPLLDELKGDGELDQNDFTAITAQIEPTREQRVILAPGFPLSLSIPSRLERLDGDGPFAAIRPPGDTLPSGATYTVTALVPKVSEIGLTKAALRDAGTIYPTDIIARYATVTDPAAFERNPVDHESVQALAARLIKENNLGNPFDIADRFQYYLSDPKNFRYNANVSALCRAGEPVADCFLRIKQGYCQYYATTMILMLRSQGIPARLDVGYLPPGEDGVVLSSAAHAWVEVYFPGHGWVSFDPTGGNGAAPVQYPEGLVGPSPSPSFAGHEGPEPTIPGGRDPNAPDVGVGTSTRDIGTSLLPIALGALAVVLLAVLVWRRMPRRQPDPLVVYGRMTRLAGLFGYPPRAAQTVFEYTGSLAEVVPEAKPELESVARAKVEATYRPVPLERERLLAVGQAYRRLRIRLARLLFRRRGRVGGGTRASVRRRRG
jgi:transglutaminase-like putative cysteine protease